MSGATAYLGDGPPQYKHFSAVELCAASTPSNLIANYSPDQCFGCQADATSEVRFVMCQVPSSIQYGSRLVI